MPKKKGLVKLKSVTDDCGKESNVVDISDFNKNKNKENILKELSLQSGKSVIEVMKKSISCEVRLKNMNPDFSTKNKDVPSSDDTTYLTSRVQPCQIKLKKVNLSTMKKDVLSDTTNKISRISKPLVEESVLVVQQRDETDESDKENDCNRTSRTRSKKQCTKENNRSKEKEIWKEAFSDKRIMKDCLNDEVSCANNGSKKDAEELGKFEKKSGGNQRLKEAFDSDGNLRSDYEDSDMSLVEFDSDELNQNESADFDSSSSNSDADCESKRKKRKTISKKKKVHKKRSTNHSDCNGKIVAHEDAISSGTSKVCDDMYSRKKDKNTTPMKYISGGFVDEPQHEISSYFNGKSKVSSGMRSLEQNDLISTPVKMIHRISARDLGVVTPKGKKESHNKEYHSRISYSIHSYALAKKIDLENTKLELSHFEDIRDHGVKDLGILLPTNTAKKLFDFYYNTDSNEKFDKYVDSSGFHKYPDTCSFFHCKTLPVILKENKPNILDVVTEEAKEESCEELQTRCHDLADALLKEKARSAALLKGINQDTPKKNTNVLIYKCPFCKVECHRSDSLKSHIKKHHPEADLSSDDIKNILKDKKIQCKYCDKSVSHRSIYRHEQTCNKKDQIVALVNSPLKLDKRSGYCHICKTVKSKLLQHMKIHESLKKENITGSVSSKEQAEVDKDLSDGVSMKGSSEVKLFSSKLKIKNFNFRLKLSCFHILNIQRRFFVDYSVKKRLKCWRNSRKILKKK